MKILFLFFTLLIASSFGFAQTMDEGKVSSVILTQFQSQFSEAEQVEWRKEKNFYKATFHNVEDKLQNELWYTPDGKVQKHVEEFSSDDLSENIKKHIRRKHKAYNIDKVYRVTENNEMKYKVQIEKYDGQIFLFYNEDGRRLKRP